MKSTQHEIKALILDMDGVVWRDTSTIGDLPKIFSKMRELGLKFTMATNNSTRTISEYVEKFAALGVTLNPEEILNSSQTTAQALRERFPQGTEIFTIGESGLYTSLNEEGLHPVGLQNLQEPKAVVMGIDRSINFEKMAEAALLVNSGLPFYATNPDVSFPTSRGFIPGNGAWINVIKTATGVEPIIAGKPEPEMLRVAMLRMGTSIEETIMVGDRYETDIMAGQKIGCITCLVLSGVTSYEKAKKISPQPDFICADLSALLDLLSK